MLLAMVAFFLQIERGGMYSEITPGNETFLKRGPDQLSWLEARKACDSMSSVILPGMRAARALGLLQDGEFAWIDGKQYSFCHAKMCNKFNSSSYIVLNAKTDASEKKEKCRYVTARREDTRENLTYICNSGDEYVTKDEMVPYADAIKQCMKSKTSLLVVKNFALPMVVPSNRTNWIGNYSDSSINSSLSPGQTVTEICIGIVKLDHDKSEFATTSCDENHTVLCDASGFDTALTLTTRDETMPPLGDMKARKIPENRKDGSKNNNDLIFISSGATSGVLLLVIAIIVIVFYRKWKLNQNLPYLSKSRQRSCAVQRRHDREMLPGDHFMRQDIESERKLLPSNSFKVKNSTQGQNNSSRHIKADLRYHKNESPIASSQNPIEDNNSSDPYHLQGYALLAMQAALCGKAMSSGSQKCLFPAREGYTIPKNQTATGKERERINVMHTDDEDQYENYRKVAMPSEYQVTILDSN